MEPTFSPWSRQRTNCGGAPSATPSPTLSTAISISPTCASSDALSAASAASPATRMPIFIRTNRSSPGRGMRKYLLALKESGLGSIPGTAAEILDDSVRRHLSPNKLKVRQWVEIVKMAHALGIPTTSTMMYGHTEQPEHWVRHMILLRD